jgi:hypothetical protein
VILFCSLGSLALGALVYLRSQRLAEVQTELRRVKEVIREIQTDAYRLGDLHTLASKENLKPQSEPESYIRSFTAEDRINIGQVEIRKSTKEPMRGIEDNIYTIVPGAKNQRYSLGQIGNFLYKLEHESRRVKVTRLRLTPTEKVVAGEVGKGLWTFEADLTTRTKQETAPGAGGG